MRFFKIGLTFVLFFPRSFVGGGEGGHIVFQVAMVASASRRHAPNVSDVGQQAQTSQLQPLQGHMTGHCNCNAVAGGTLTVVRVMYILRLAKLAPTTNLLYYYSTLPIEQCFLCLCFV
jgi:hypothetical protein